MLTVLGCLSNSPLLTMLTAAPWFQPQPLLSALDLWPLNSCSSLCLLSHHLPQPPFAQLPEVALLHPLRETLRFCVSPLLPCPSQSSNRELLRLPKCLCSYDSEPCTSLPPRSYPPLGFSLPFRAQAPLQAPFSALPPPQHILIASVISGRVLLSSSYSVFH